MVYVLGDIHGNFSPIYKWLNNFAEEGDTLIQVGDFGAGFVNPNIFECLGRALEEKGVKLLAIRGNHDKPKPFKKEIKIGGINFVSDYSVKKIEGETFLFLGGAISIDRCNRKEGFDWWRGEEFNLDENKLINLTGIDRVISHTCPSFSLPVLNKKGGIVDYYSQFDSNLKKSLQKEQEAVERAHEILSKNNKLKSWHFGHFHTFYSDNFSGTLFKCLNIDEITIL